MGRNLDTSVLTMPLQATAGQRRGSTTLRSALFPFDTPPAAYQQCAPHQPSSACSQKEHTPSQARDLLLFGTYPFPRTNTSFEWNCSRRQLFSLLFVACNFSVLSIAPPFTHLGTLPSSLALHLCLKAASGAKCLHTLQVLCQTLPLGAAKNHRSKLAKQIPPQTSLINMPGETLDFIKTLLA